MYYGDERESKVNICHTLMELGWKIYGYKPDKSDSMTDYYDPASWDGIATKNGYVLCVDIPKWRSNYSGKEIFEYHRPKFTFKANAKIEQLNKLANDRAATPAEKQAALDAIHRINESAKAAEEKAEKEKVLIEKWPEYQQNPPHSNWHIERNGTIVAKGRGAFQFHNLPYWVDPMTELPKDTHRAWELSEDNKKDLEKFRSFINKVESVVSLKLGNDGAEDAYKIITVTEYRTEIKAREVRFDNLDSELEPGMSFKLMAYFNHGCAKGSIYKIKDDTNGVIRSVKLNRSLKKELTGSAIANHFNCPYEKFKNWVESGAISMVELYEDKTPYEVEKCVKNTPTKSTNNRVVNKETQNQKITYSVAEDVDTRDNSQIFVVKINETLSKEDYYSVKAMMKSHGGYYSKFKHGFIFKEDPSGWIGSANVDNQEAKKIKRETKVASTKTDKNKIIEKINKQIESVQKKIDALSGDHLCNTWKRMREQESRDQKILSYRFDIEILTYLLNTIGTRELTKLELALITDSFRTEIDGYYRRNNLYNSDKRPSAAMPIKYPKIDPSLADWYNAEVPKKQKRLNKAGIFNTQQLLNAVEEYGAIVDAATKPVDQTQMKIKKLERECIMMQKGDINFTPPEVAKYLIELARIDSDSFVLEPSAGIARIADEIKAVTPNVDVVEQMCDFRELLTLKGHNLVGDDFMQLTTDKLYDAVIANPPFSEEEAHIKHMYELLKPGGTLVTICSPHWTFASDKKAIEFRNWVEELDGYTKDLPSGTFEMTGVVSKILVIEKKAS